MITGGIFGGKKKRGWEFDPQSHGPGNEWGRQTAIGELPQQVQPQPEQPKKQGFFQRPGVHEGIATFVDTLAKLRRGIDLGMMDGINQGKQREFAEAQYERKRRDDYEDWLKQQQFKQNNPEPNALERNVEWMQRATPEQKAAMGEYYNIVTPKIFTGGDGRPYQIGRGGGYDGGLDSQPTTEDGMTYTPGPGGRANPSNWKELGGGVGNNAGKFPGQ